jgi:hypothetical protein
MSDRTCIDCGADISGIHGNAKRCLECRNALAPPSKNLCINGDGNPVQAHGLCPKCYMYAKRHGVEFKHATLVERFWVRVNKDGPVPPKHPELGPCWLWTGRTSDKGYGSLYVDGEWVWAHYIAYELSMDEAIPEGVRVGHLCEVKGCVNPAHLEIMMSVTDALRTASELLAPADRTGGVDADLAYWAALIDGEGHIAIRYTPVRTGGGVAYQARFSLRMTDLGIVQKFADRFGLKVLPKSYKSALSVLPLYAAECSCGPAAQLLAVLLPYLRLKRRQAELAIMLEEEKRQPGLRTRFTSVGTYRRRDGGTVTRKRYSTGQEHLDRWHGYYLEVRSLNKPGRDFGRGDPACLGVNSSCSLRPGAGRTRPVSFLYALKKRAVDPDVE